LLLQLVPRSRIALLSQYALDPEISVHWKEAEGIPSARGGLEELVRLQPDLVLVSSYSSPTLISLLKSRGVRVLEIGVINDFDALRELILQAGHCVGEEARADEIIRGMEARIERLKAKRPVIESRPKAMFYFQDGFAPGPRSFANAILELAGFSNVGARINGGEGVNVSMETVLMSRPDVLILTRYCESHPTLTQLDWAHPLFRQLAMLTKIISVPFTQLASPDPENLALAETLQQLLLK
jgi:iron complex transport system substrate-binding protein